jgi:hypothetical protein
MELCWFAVKVVLFVIKPRVCLLGSAAHCVVKLRSSHPIDVGDFCYCTVRVRVRVRVRVAGWVPRTPPRLNSWRSTHVGNYRDCCACVRVRVRVLA